MEELLHAPHPLETILLSRRFRLEDSASIDTFLANEGFAGFRKALAMSPDEIINEVKASNLRGRGGAGFPAGMKWSFVDRKSSKPRYVVVNADESEPGTCKDRVILQYDPFRLIEGCLIAARAIDSERGWIYVRGEYRYLIEHLNQVLDTAYRRGWLGRNIQGTGMNFDLATQSGAGAYECGEESALLESLEGKRGNPRLKPPFPAQVGAFQCPTVLNNVETFSAVPDIILKGGRFYSQLGTPKNGGTRLLCISGHVNRPGVYEVRLGMNMLEAVNGLAGGVAGGRALKAIVPGGSSCPVLKAEECDIPMDYDSLAKAGSMLGSGGMVVLDETADMVKFLARIMKFYAHESCGWCIPCREGTAWLKSLLGRFHSGAGLADDVDTALDVFLNMLGKTLCPLGDAAAMPTISILKKFRSEFEEHLKLGYCPYEKKAVAVA
ncbi:MAG: NADH-quinone oxidoreductase subunit NuoF [Bryobacteraceae bacterium]